jgi:hypothetical protein
VRVIAGQWRGRPLVAPKAAPNAAPGAPPMSPQQGYVVSLLFFAVTAYALFLAYRARGKDDD